MISILLIAFALAVILLLAPRAGPAESPRLPPVDEPDAGWSAEWDDWPVALDLPTVDRAAEHDRLERRVRESAPTAAAQGGLHLREPGALRRAVLLSEVLGPPRALREHP